MKELDPDPMVSLLGMGEVSTMALGLALEMVY